jgi:isoleucyl-tRNA synthetase
MPHISESVYQNLKTDNDPESVHLTPGQFLAKK